MDPSQYDRRDLQHRNPSQSELLLAACRSDPVDCADVPGLRRTLLLPELLPGTHPPNENTCLTGAPPGARTLNQWIKSPRPGNPSQPPTTPLTLVRAAMPTGRRSARPCSYRAVPTRAATNRLPRHAFRVGGTPARRAASRTERSEAPRSHASSVLVRRELSTHPLDVVQLGNAAVTRSVATEADPPPAPPRRPASVTPPTRQPAHPPSPPPVRRCGRFTSATAAEIETDERHDDGGTESRVGLPRHAARLGLRLRRWLHDDDRNTVRRVPSCQFDRVRAVRLGQPHHLHRNEHPATPTLRQQW